MSLMRLNPAVKRLRRIAKAHAAGEVSRWEYRETRRLVIQQFGPVLPDVDDTLPRVALDVTHRHSPASASNTPIDQPRRMRLWWCFVLALVAAILLLPAAGIAAPIDIDAVDIDANGARDHNPATAQRLLVQEVVWQVPEGLDDVSQSEVDDFLRQGLTELQAGNKPLDHGFTADELTELGRFLDAVGVHESRTRFTRDDILDLAALVQAQKSKRGVSTVQLETLATRLQVWLRERGYALASAYLPGQTVQDGVVSLAVELGRLSSVVVQGAQQPGLARSMGALLGEVVQRDAIVTRLNVLNRTPGIQTTASFAPSAEVGAAELRLQPQDLRRWLGGAWIDNHGVVEGAEERVGGYVQRNQLRDGADMLRLSGYTGVGEGSALFARALYQTPVLAGRYHVAASIAAGDMELESAEQADLAGTLVDVSVTDTRLFTRRQRLEWVYRFGVHDLRGDQRLGASGALEQRATFVGAQLQGHHLWDAARVALEGQVGLDVGRVDQTLPGEQANWWRLSTGGRVWQPLPLWPAAWSEKPKAVLVWRGQLAGSTLPATQRLATTGVEINRGFARGSAVSVDAGLGISAQLHFTTLRGTLWGFVDSTYGTLEADASWQHNTSIGLGWRSTLWRSEQGSVSSRLSLALPVSHKGKNTLAGEDGAHLYWRIGYEH